MTALEITARKYDPMPCRYLITSFAHARIRPIIGCVTFSILNMLGNVIHAWSKIGQRIKICPGVSLCQAETYQPVADSKFTRIAAILSLGWIFLSIESCMQGRQRTFWSGHAVLLGLTGENEIFTAIPARNIGLCTP
jgi:hypothetical protein